MRSGAGWENQWVQFDFMAVKRIVRVRIVGPPSSRNPVRVRLDHSLGGGTFYRGPERNIPFDKIINLADPIISRFVRIVVVETNDVTENINSLKMFQ